MEAQEDVLRESRINRASHRRLLDVVPSARNMNLIYSTYMIYIEIG
jgi:hypothetical protein